MTPHLLKAALKNLHSTTLRTALAMLGIIVGTAAVVALVSTGQMATEQALMQFKTLGTDLLSFSLYTRESSGKGNDDSGRKKIKMEDWHEVGALSPDILKVAPYTIIYTLLSYRGQPINGSVIGATGHLAGLIRLKILEGRFISSYDRYERYCVLGNQIYQTLKQYTDNPLGQHIRIGDYIYEIIGIADAWPESGFFEQDINNSILIPIRTANFVSNYVDINNFILRISPTADISAIRNKIEEHLQKKFPNRQPNFRSAKELISSMAAQHKIFTLLLSLIGSISLLVGGIGVMNIMLVSVLERRREIGIRLALGAHGKEIQHMFLTEAILLAVIGGIIGTLVGILFSLIVALIAHWNFHFFLLPPLIGFTVSVLIGIFFGYYPAHRASKLNPIETLRTE